MMNFRGCVEGRGLAQNIPLRTEGIHQDPSHDGLFWGRESNPWLLEYDVGRGWWTLDNEVQLAEYEQPLKVI